MKIMSSYKDYAPMTVKVKKLRQFPVLSNSIGATGSFDGVAWFGLCGIGMFLQINDEHQFKLRMNCGKGTNTKFELLALCCLAKVAYILSIDSLSVIGSSMVIVNWTKKLVLYKSFPFFSGTSRLNLCWLLFML